MADGSEIDLGNDLGDVHVDANGIHVEIRREGYIVAYVDGGLPVICEPARVAESYHRAFAGSPYPSPGDAMPDGTIFAGISPDTDKPMYTTQADAPLTMKWGAAMQYADGLDAHGHQDWRMPTKGELNMLWENRDKGKLKGTFNETSSERAGWYWSSAEFDIFNARAQRFSDGTQDWNYKGFVSSLRCVR